MQRRATIVVLASALAAGLVFAACDSSSNTNACGSGTPPSLVGTYALVSATFGPETYSTATGYSGTLTFTATRYTFSVVGPNPTPPPATVTLLADSGTYTVTGSKCIGENSDTGNPQFTGTFTLSGTTPGSTLTVTGSAATVPVTFIATKQ
jgi:hypothetical protein